MGVPQQQGRSALENNSGDRADLKDTKRKKPRSILKKTSACTEGVLRINTHSAADIGNTVGNGRGTNNIGNIGGGNTSGQGTHGIGDISKTCTGKTSKSNIDNIRKKCIGEISITFIGRISKAKDNDGGGCGGGVVIGHRSGSGSGSGGGDSSPTFKPTVDRRWVDLVRMMSGLPPCAPRPDQPQKTHDSNQDATVAGQQQGGGKSSLEKVTVAQRDNMAESSQAVDKVCLVTKGPKLDMKGRVKTMKLRAKSKPPSEFAKDLIARLLVVEKGQTDVKDEPNEKMKVKRKRKKKGVERHQPLESKPGLEEEKEEEAGGGGEDWARERERRLWWWDFAVSVIFIAAHGVSIWKAGSSGGRLESEPEESVPTSRATWAADFREMMKGPWV